jgi:hypothetical protein
MSPALQIKRAVLIEGNACIGAIHFLLHDEMAPHELRKRDRFQVFITWLQPGALNMPGSRVLAQPVPAHR